MIQRVLTGFAVGGVLLIAFLLIRRPTAQQQVAGETPTHMHCPECKHEVKSNSKLEGQKCPQCGPTGPVLVSTAGPFAKSTSRTAGTANSIGAFLAAFMVFSVVGQGAVYAAVLYRRRQLARSEDAKKKALFCRCSFCNRRIGYSVKLVGTAVKCPKCKTAFLLPPPEEAEESSPPT